MDLLGPHNVQQVSSHFVNEFDTMYDEFGISLFWIGSGVTNGPHSWDDVKAGRFITLFWSPLYEIMRLYSARMADPLYNLAILNEVDHKLAIDFTWLPLEWRCHLTKRQQWVTIITFFIDRLIQSESVDDKATVMLQMYYTWWTRFECDDP